MPGSSSLEALSPDNHHLIGRPGSTGVLCCHRNVEVQFHPCRAHSSWIFCSGPLLTPCKAALTGAASLVLSTAINRGNLIYYKGVGFLLVFCLLFFFLHLLLLLIRNPNTNLKITDSPAFAPLPFCASFHPIHLPGSGQARTVQWGHVHEPSLPRARAASRRWRWHSCVHVKLGIS